MRALLVTQVPVAAARLTQQAVLGLLGPLKLVTRTYTAAQQLLQQLQQQQQQSCCTQQPPATQHAQQQHSTAQDQQQSRSLPLPQQQHAAHSAWQLRCYTTGAATQYAARDQDNQQQQLRWQLQQQLNNELQDDVEYVRRPRADNWRPGQQRHEQQQQQQQQRRRPPAQDSWRPQRQQQQQREMHPAAITSQMMKADAPQQLLELVAQHSAALNRIHIIAALNKAAELWPGAATGTSGADSDMVLGRQQLQHLVNMLAGPFTRSMVHYACREISSGLWAYATCQLQPPPALLAAAADAVCSWDKLQGGEAKHLVSLGWALAKFGCKDRPVLAALAAALWPHVSDLSPKQVSVVLWAFGRSGFRDQHLLQQLANRSRQLLLNQQQQVQQPEQTLGRAAARELRLAQFDTKSLSNTVWGLSALHWQDAQVMAAAASLAAAAPLVYSFRPYEAVNLLKGFAAAAAAQGDDSSSSSRDSASSSSSSRDSTNSDDEAPLEQQVHAAFEHSNEAIPGANPSRELVIQLWPAACAVAAATLRRLDEASPQCVLRMMWSLAALHQAAVRVQQQSQQGPSISVAATQDGRVVFGQLAAALHLQWGKQAAVHPVGLTVTAWALVMAQESGLVPALLLQQPGKGSTAAAGHATEVLQQLAATVVSASQGQQQQLKVHLVADLAAAFDRLCRPLQSSSSSFASAPGSSSSGEPAVLPSEAPAAAEADSAAAAAAAAPTSPSNEEHQLPGGQFAAAVAALADAAQQLAAGAAPGQLSGGDTVHNVSKMLAAFGRMQVIDESLYQALLRHWTPQNLQACSGESLVGAARAATWLAMAQPGLVSSGVLPGEIWEQLLQLCLKRWPQLIGRQRAALQPVSANMPAEVAAQYADVAAEFRRIVDGTKQGQ